MADLHMKLPLDEIIDHFDGLKKTVFTQSDLGGILEENREFWRLSNSVTEKKFIQFLLKKKKLKAVKFQFANDRIVMRYFWGSATDNELILSLKPKSYFSHYTAMALHDLTEQIPNTIYLNYEQSPKNIKNFPIEQSKIDIAFKQPPRMSKNIVAYKKQKICVLNSMHTNRLGVIDIDEIPVTNIERTLIDISVRPFYSGGIFEVQKAYRNAKGQFSVNALTAMLKKLNYIYPYHQAIGFYLENSGVYKSSAVDLLQKFDLNFDFYLTHQMDKPAYSKKWRLYYPKGL